MNSKVDWFFEKAGKWQKEFELLRSIVLDCQLAEDLKWGQPCYLYENKNIVLIHGFKDYCALLFFKGALLKDSKRILIQQTANVQAARQVRFTDVNEIRNLKSALKSYIYEAVEIEEAGLKVPLKQPTEFPVPEEFEKRLARSQTLKKAFYTLTPGRQRAYLLYFAQAKQSKTRDARIEKYLPKIREGKGLND